MKKELQTGELHMNHVCLKSDHWFSFFIPFCGLFGLSPIALIIWGLKKDECPLINYHGRAYVNLFLTKMLILALFYVCWLLWKMLLLLPSSFSSAVFGILGALCGLFGLFLYLFYFISLIIATVKAWKGKIYRYRLVVRFISLPSEKL